MSETRRYFYCDNTTTSKTQYLKQDLVGQHWVITAATDDGKRLILALNTANHSLQEKWAIAFCLLQP